MSSRFLARFLVDSSSDLEQLQDQDIYVTVTGGPTTYDTTVMTLQAIDAALRQWTQTGEAAGGSYLWSTDLVITSWPGITAMIEAIDGLVREGALHVLTASRPRIVRHIGVVMHAVGAVPDGRLLAVALIEETDDKYLVVGARWLNEDEAQPLRKLMERGRAMSRAEDIRAAQEPLNSQDWSDAVVDDTRRRRR